jgi:putative transposase
MRAYLREKGIYQEFSHVATPQDNAYIEALHSNLQREVIDVLSSNPSSMLN